MRPAACRVVQAGMVAYWIDIGIAQVVDHVREKLDQPEPKCRLLLMGQYADLCSLRCCTSRTAAALAHK